MAPSDFKSIDPQKIIDTFVCDPLTGFVTRKGTGKRAEFISGRYLWVKCDSRQVAAHRVVWVCCNGSWPTGQIDHINGNRHDNRIENLRDVSVTVNQQNQKGPRVDNKLGVMGVYLKVEASRNAAHKIKKPYCAAIRFGGRQHQLGTFATAEEAHSAYIEAKRKHHSGNTI